MAKTSIVFPDENRDKVIAIVLILGIILLFMYPLAAVVGAAIIAVPFIVTWAVNTGRPS
jgi:hypothetical protein